MHDIVTDYARVEATEKLRWKRTRVITALQVEGLTAPCPPQLREFRMTLTNTTVFNASPESYRAACRAARNRLRSYVYGDLLAVVEEIRLAIIGDDLKEADRLLDEISKAVSFE